MNGKIHFLNTGHSDCIIIESENHFAMIDAGEDSDFPADKPHLNLKGYEDVVIEYLLKNCKGENGIVTLDFILGTHAHSDHIGGFDTVINHPLIDIKKAFLKPYSEDEVFVMERKRWDNTEVYTQMLNALKNKNVEIIDNITSTPFKLGNLKITLLNGEKIKRKVRFGENINTVVTLVEANGTKVVLAGDLNNKTGDEKRLAKIIGKVDLLKVGHHGYSGSTSYKWAKTLAPKYAVITNSKSRIMPDVKFKLKNVAKSEVIATEDLNGIIAELYDGGNITIKTNIM